MLRAMALRFPVVVLALLLSGGAANSAKPEAKASSKRTWRTLVDHMLVNGSADSIKTHSARTMGFDTDKVETKGLYLKAADSKDGCDHSFEVVLEATDKKEVSTPREIVLGRTRVTEINSIKSVEGNRLRISLDGHPIRGMHASGIVGKVKQDVMRGDSQDAKGFLSAEGKFWLKEVDLAKLSQ